MQANEVQRSGRFAVRGEAEHWSWKHTHSLLGHHVVHDRAEVVGGAAVGTLAVVVDDEAVGGTHPLEACACGGSDQVSGANESTQGSIMRHRGVAGVKRVEMNPLHFRLTFFSSVMESGVGFFKCAPGVFSPFKKFQQ